MSSVDNSQLKWNSFKVLRDGKCDLTDFLMTNIHPPLFQLGLDILSCFPPESWVTEGILVDGGLVEGNINAVPAT